MKKNAAIDTILFPGKPMGKYLTLTDNCLVLDSAYQKINAKISVTIFISLFQNNTYRNIQIIAKLMKFNATF